MPKQDKKNQEDQDQELNQEQQQEEEQENEDTELRDQDKDEGDFVKLPKKDYKAMKDRLKRSNSEAAKRRNELDRYKEIADDPEELSSLLEQLQNKEDRGDNTKDDDQQKALVQRQLAKQRKEIESKYQRELEQERKLREQMEKDLQNTVLLQQAESVILEHDGVPDLIMDRVVKHAKVVKDGNRYVTQIVDDNGEIEFNDRGEYATLEDFITTLKNDDKFGRAFGAPKKAGAGVRNQHGSEQPSKGNKFGNLRRSQMSPREQDKFVQEHGHDTFFSLKP